MQRNVCPSLPLWLPPFLFAYLPTYLLPTYRPTNIYHTPTWAKSMFGAPRWKDAVPALSGYYQKGRTTTHTNYNTVDGWNGVCQVDRRKEAFQIRVHTLAKGREASEHPSPIQQVFPECLLCATHWDLNMLGKTWDAYYDLSVLENDERGAWMLSGTV